MAETPEELMAIVTGDDIKAAQIASLEYLRRFCDHAFLTAEGVEKLTKPFGFKGYTYTEHVNPRDPKGVTFNDGRKSGEGADAMRVAEQIATHLGLGYTIMMGRGSALRDYCERALDFIKGEHPRQLIEKRMKAAGFRPTRKRASPGSEQRALQVTPPSARKPKK
jgi:hypothetical protein